MNKKNRFKKTVLIILELALFLILFLLAFSFSGVDAVIGENVTVETYLQIGTSSPNINQINIHDGTLNLIPNSTKTVNCTAEIEDFDGDTDVINVTAVFFHNSSFYGDDDAGNHHYTNDSCYIDYGYGDEYTLKAHCFFEVVYYANPGTWNCTVYAEDYSGYSDEKSNTTIVNELLAIGLPDAISYGEVNATFVSEEQVANVTNFGNVDINLSLSGYARTEGDNLSMNCSLGGIGEIPIRYQKYNLSESTPSPLNLAQFGATYLNLTSSPVIKQFNLVSKKDDSPDLMTNSTYWRIYVPLGVAGTCQGNIIFGAVKGEGD
jgi:hypothetical protein